MRSMRASDAEWEAIKLFAKYIKDNPDSMNEILVQMKNIQQIAYPSQISETK